MRTSTFFPRSRLAPSPLDLQTVAWAVYGAANLGLSLYFVRFGPQGDWSLWAALPDALSRGQLYAPHHELPFVWSPVAGWMLAWLVVPIGYWMWAALHVATVFLLADRRLIALTLLSWPFWHDVAEGNTMTFVVVAGVLALRGNRWAVLTYIGLLLLMPRPVQLPLAIWLLWKQPDSRIPFLLLFSAHALVVLAVGDLVPWVEAIRSYGGAAALQNSIGPPRWFGYWWLIAGIPLGVLLLSRGYVGMAGLSISPYWLPIYLLMALPDVDRHRRPEAMIHD